MGYIWVGRELLAKQMSGDVFHGMVGGTFVGLANLIWPVFTVHINLGRGQ